MLRCLTHPPPEALDRSEILLFSKMRNEALRLPYFLGYYRRLGVDRFIIVDNGSKDETRAIVGSQPDIHVFATEDSFAAAGGGQLWLNELLDRHGHGHWCLTVDADELLTYPNSEQKPLPHLLEALEEEGAEALDCMLLDMYGAGPLRDSAYRAGEPFLEACSWFDPGPYRPRPASECPYYEIYGGVRQRVFFPHWQGPDPWVRVAERLFSAASRLGVSQNWRVRPPPNLAKVPLVRWRRGHRYLAATHKITPVARSAGSGLLLHFKFLSGFATKVADEARRGEYFDGASEYRRYASELAEDPELSLWHEGSVRLVGSEQLCALGLMRRVPCLHEAPTGAAGVLLADA